MSNCQPKVARKANVFAILITLAITCGGSLAYGDTLYGITSDDNLISVNTSNPGAANLVGVLNVTAASLGIFSNAGNLYVYDTNSNVLRQISPTTAATIATINLGLAAAPGEGDVAFQNGVGYLVSTLQPDGSFGATGTLFKFTLSANSATVISTSIPLLDGLAFSSAGVLYGLSQGGTSLYTINTTTGAATLVGGGTGIDDNCGGFACYSFGGLSFGTSGTLFADLTNFSSPTSSFFTIDPNTGAATANGAIPFDQVSGLTSATPIVVTPTPEPTTLLLAGGALLALGIYRRNLARS